MSFTHATLPHLETRVMRLGIASNYGISADDVRYAAERGVGYWLHAGRRGRAISEGLREALCTVGNGYFATRGALPESASDAIHHPGTYVAGVLAEGTVNRSVVEHGWLVGTSLLRDVAFALRAYGLLVTAAGWLAGTSRHAVAARRWVAPRLRRHPLPAGGVALAFGLAMLAWAPGGGDRRLAGTLVMCALFAVAVAALWRQSLREFPVAAEGRSAQH